MASSDMSLEGVVIVEDSAHGIGYLDQQRLAIASKLSESQKRQVMRMHVQKTWAPRQLHSKHQTSR